MPSSPSDSPLHVVDSPSADATTVAARNAHGAAAETGESVKSHRSALDCAAARDCNPALDPETRAGIAAFYMLLTGAITWWLTLT